MTRIQRWRSLQIVSRRGIDELVSMRRTRAKELEHASDGVIEAGAEILETNRERPRSRLGRVVYESRLDELEHHALALEDDCLRGRE